MYTIILSCEHQAGQNRGLRIGDYIECPTCHEHSQVVDVQEHKRAAAYAKVVAAMYLDQAETHCARKGIEHESLL